VDHGTSALMRAGAGPPYFEEHMGAKKEISHIGRTWLQERNQVKKVSPISVPVTKIWHEKSSQNDTSTESRKEYLTIHMRRIKMNCILLYYHNYRNCHQTKRSLML